MKRGLSLAAVFILGVVAGGAIGLGVISHGATTSPPHVLIVMEENKGYTATLGTCSADPYLCSLAKAYASDTNWYGVSHPSEPNYVAIGSGAIHGCTSDSACKADTLAFTDLGGQLTSKAIPWVAYMESMPSACYKGGGSGGYALKHNPFGFFKDNYVGACHIQPYPGEVKMLAAIAADQFVWITPNLSDDMHDGSVQQGDAWLKANIAPVLASPWFLNSPSTVIITMDEHSGDNLHGGGHVPMVVISSNAKGKGAVVSFGDHYGTLRSIEEVYSLSLLGSASKTTVGDLSVLFG